MSNRAIETGRQHVIPSNLLLIVVEILIAILVWYSGDWFFSGSEETFGTLHSYIFIWTTVIIASTASLNSIFASLSAHDSLTVTRNSLELTRGAIRPFMTVIEYKEEPFKTDSGQILPAIWLTLTNSGGLPADNIYAAIKLVEVESGGNLNTLKEQDKPLGVLFPSQKYNVAQIINAEHVSLFNEGKTRIYIDIRYKVGENPFYTIQAYSIGSRIPNTERVLTVIPEEQSWK